MMSFRIIRAAQISMVLAIFAVTAAGAQNEQKPELTAPPPPPPPQNSTSQQYDDVEELNRQVREASETAALYSNAIRISYSEFLEHLNQGEIIRADVAVFGQWVYFQTCTLTTYSVRVAQHHDLADRLALAGAKVQFVSQLPTVGNYTAPSFWSMLGYEFFRFVPWVLVFMIAFFLIWRGQTRRARAYQVLLESEKKRSEEFFERLEKLLTENKNTNG